MGATTKESQQGRPAPAKEKLLLAAERLFYARGVHAVGIDEIIGAAGVAKMSLYNHFDSKDELIVAWLHRRHEKWMEQFVGRVRAVRTTAERRPLAVFDALGEWFAEKDFRGCAFLNTAAELCDPRHPGRAVCREHVEAVREFIEGLLEEAGVRRAGEMSSRLVLLVEGAIVRAVVSGSAEPAREAREMAEVLLRGRE